MILTEVMPTVTQLRWKKFYEIDTCGQYYKTFLGIIDATSSVFPYDFDCSYADSDIITLKKVLWNWHLLDIFHPVFAP